MYAKGQTLKITATKTNPYRNIFKNTLTVTIIAVNDNTLTIQLSAEDTKLHPRGRDTINVVFEGRAVTFYPDWNIEIVDAPIIEIAPVVVEAPDFIDIEASKALAEKFEVGWRDPRDTGTMYDQQQPAAKIEDPCHCGNDDDPDENMRCCECGRQRHMTADEIYERAYASESHNGPQWDANERLNAELHFLSIQNYFDGLS